MGRHHGRFHDPLHDRGFVVDSNDEPESCIVSHAAPLRRSPRVVPGKNGVPRYMQKTVGSQARNNAPDSVLGAFARRMILVGHSVTTRPTMPRPQELQQTPI